MYLLTLPQPRQNATRRTPRPRGWIWRAAPWHIYSAPSPQHRVPHPPYSQSQHPNTHTPRRVRSQSAPSAASISGKWRCMSAENARATLCNTRSPPRQHLPRRHSRYSSPQRVAGSYTESVAVGDVVEVASECCTELPERFRQTYIATCPISKLRTVRSATVHGAGCECLDAEIENMEGAALYAVATAQNICATELRAISNRVGEEFAEWHFDEAAEALANTLKNCIIDD